MPDIPKTYPLVLWIIVMKLGNIMLLRLKKTGWIEVSFKLQQVLNYTNSNEP